MNWGLLQIGMLAGLTALAIPVVIHLMFRQKPRDMPIGSIRFLRQIHQQHGRRRKIVRWLLLSLRLVMISVLAIVFARPYFHEATMRLSGDRSVVILIDRSASMQMVASGARLIERAVEEARKTIQSAEAESQITVAFFDNHVAPITPKDTQAIRADILRQLTAPQESYAATDYGSAMRWARDICASAKTKHQEIHIYTDLQRSGLAWSDGDRLPADVVTTIHDLGHDLPSNVAIIACSPTQRVVRPDDGTSIEVTLANVGPYPLEESNVALELQNGDRQIRQQYKIAMSPDSTTQLKFDVRGLAAGLWQGRVVVETIDSLQFDNQRFVAIMAADPSRILIMDGQLQEFDRLCESYYLQLAIDLGPKKHGYPQSPYMTNVVDGSIGAPPLAGYQAVVLANLPHFSNALADQLNDFVRNGGSLLIFLGDAAQADDYQSLSDRGLLPGTIVAVRETDNLPWRLGSVPANAPLFAPFGDPQHVDLQQIAFRGIVEVRADSPENVVARFDDGTPFILKSRVGNSGGTVLCVTTACDNQWSDWTESDLYVPIIHQMLAHLTGRDAVGPVREEIIESSSHGETTATPGIFPENRYWRVVNTSPRESETDRCTKSEFVDRFGLQMITEQNVRQQETAALSGVPTIQSVEIWYWLLYMALVTAAAEFLIANRTACV